MIDFIIGQRGFLSLLVQTFTPRPTLLRETKVLSSDSDMISVGQRKFLFSKKLGCKLLPARIFEGIE